MTITTFFHWLFFAIASASLALVALTWLEGALTIWFPRSADSRFWSTFDKLKLTLKYISASEEKLSAARFITEKMKEGKLENEN